MIDIHCHILPNFDDGAANLKEALSMARMAADSGVTGIAATPHFRGEEASLASLPRLLEVYQSLARAVRREGISLSLLPGAEILCLPQTLELAKDKSLPTIGDTDYLLTEFFFDETPAYMNSMFRSLTDCGYKVVIAHPERYDAIQRNPGLLEEWFRRGYVIQLNKGSVLGAFGSRAERTADIALRHGFAHLIASDAHSSIRRTTNMHPLRLRLQEKCLPEYTHILLEQNPLRLIQNQEMTPVT